MKFINQSAEIIPQEEGINGIYKQIELAGRVCYKSEDKITEDSAKEFVDRMVKSGHGAMLEHGTVYLKTPNNVVDKEFQFGTNWSTLCLNPYTRYNSDGEYYYYTTNYRVIIEHNLQGVLNYLCEPTEYHERRITVKLITDQGILREFTRHRVFSFAVESTRYCNYSRNKFDASLTYILPDWISKEVIDKNFYDGSYFANPANKEVIITDRFKSALKQCEYVYMELIKNGCTPQQARNVLPLATKCEMVMTGFVGDWEHFFSLRASKAGAKGMHPQASELANMIYDKFIEAKLI